MKIFLSLMIIFSIFSPASLSGQGVIAMKSQTKGPALGIHGGYLSYTNDIVHPRGEESGIGFGAKFEYGFNHSIAGVISFQHYSVKSNTDNSTESPYPYNEIELLGKFIFGSTNSSLRPHLAVGGNYTRSKEGFVYEDPGFPDLYTVETYSGYGFSGGGGLEYFINSQLSVGLSFIYQSGTFSTIIINGDEFDEAFDFSGYKGLVGLNYHF